MTFKDLCREYQEKVCICRPRFRDAGNNHVLAWDCLETVDDVDAARGVLERLELDGVTDAVAISTTKRLVIDGDLAARYFRVYLGME